MDESACYRNPLLLPAAQFSRSMSRPGFQSYLLQHIPGALAPLAAVDPLQGQCQGDISLGSHAWNEMERLEDKSNCRAAVTVPFSRRQGAKLVSRNANAAARRSIEPAEEMQQRRLSRPANADDGQNLPAPDSQVDLGQSADFMGRQMIRAGQVPNFNKVQLCTHETSLKNARAL